MAKREILIHYLFFLSFFILLLIKRNILSWSFLPLLLGGIIGTFLADLDQFLYAFLFNPYDLASQRAVYHFKKKELFKGLLILWGAKETRTHQVFHSFSFQIIFLILTFWVVSSSGSLFAIGLVIAFSLHLFIDQFSDFLAFGNLDAWAKGFFVLNIERKNQPFYWFLLFFVFVLFCFIF